MDEYKSKQVISYVKWLTPEQGGRKKPFEIGMTFTTPAIFTDFDESSGLWSVNFEVMEFNNDYSGMLKMNFLFNNAPEKYLYKGNKFSILDGPKCIGNGVIVDDTRLVE